MLTTIIFCLFVAAIALHVYLLGRFVMEVDRLKLLRPEELDALSQLILSGSGGVKKQFWALSYLLKREYAGLGNHECVKYGDYARASFFVAALFMIVWFFLATTTSGGQF